MPAATLRFEEADRALSRPYRRFMTEIRLSSSRLTRVGQALNSGARHVRGSTRAHFDANYSRRHRAPAPREFHGRVVVSRSQHHEIFTAAMSGTNEAHRSRFRREAVSATEARKKLNRS